jgi:adenylate cyclase
VSNDDTLARVQAWLAERGVSQAEIERATKEGQLHLLVIDRAVIADPPTLTGAQVAEAAGLPLDLARRLWRALGFPDVPDDEPAFTQADVAALAAAKGLIQLGLPDTDTAIQMARVIGSSMARIAEAEVASSPVLRGEVTSLELAEVYARSADFTVPATARLLDYSWRRHLQASLRRAAAVHREEGSGYVKLAVGFADQVGSTALAQQLSERALAEVVDRFESLAYDVVVQLGGRLVKMIGDEAMYTTIEPATATEIGLALSEAYADDEMLSDVRVGIAYGPVLQRDGDCYGPVVNLANRIVKIAVPGTVVVSNEVHEALQGDDRYEWRTLRPRYLKGLGRVPLSVVRRAGAGPDVRPFRSRRRWLLREPLRQRVEGSLGRGATEEEDAGKP